MNFKDPNNPTNKEVYDMMGLDIDADVFEKAKRNLEFKATYAEFDALIAKFGSDAVMNEIAKIQARERR